MKEKVTNKLEKNVAELVILTMLLVVLLSSCGSTYYHVGTGKPMKKHCSGAWVR